MRKFREISTLLLLLAGCSATGGTETDNPAGPLKDFSSSGCKSRDEVSSSALTLASDLAGLSCVEWETQAPGLLQVKLHNFAEGCAEQYLGKGEIATDGALELSVYSTSCTALRCGSCLYDFEYELSGVATDAPLDLRLGSALCASQAATFDLSLTLPLDEQASGVVCRPAPQLVLQQYAANYGSCGAPNMPCGDCASDATTCGDGSMCTEVASGDSRCLSSCESDDDCIANLTCEAGVCVAPTSF